MKTYKNIYPSIYTYDNLHAAWRKAARGKRKSPEVAGFEYHLIDNLLQLEEELFTQSYRPGPYRHFYLREPKLRRISAAPFRDRVVHHALVQQIEPIFEARFIADSYACRVGKGTHAALRRCQELARRYRYILQCDIVQFFPAIDHAILGEILFRRLADAPTRRLIDQILSSGAGVLAGEYDMVYFPGDDLLAATRPRGLPIGNLTSQFWANCYLNHLDHFAKRELRCPAYLRYVDDFLLFADDKKTLWAWREALIERLAQLRLTIHPAAQPRPVTEGFPFLGFVIYPTHRRLKRRKVVAYRRQFRRLIAGWIAFERTREAVIASLLGWINHARYGDTWGLRSRVVAEIPRSVAKFRECG